MKQALSKGTALVGGLLTLGLGAATFESASSESLQGWEQVEVTGSLGAITLMASCFTLTAVANLVSPRNHEHEAEQSIVE